MLEPKRKMDMSTTPLTFQDMIQALEHYWAD